MGHGGGGREMQRALESQAQQQAAGGGESYQGGEGALLTGAWGRGGDFFFNWSLLALQCCVNFCCIAT